MNNGNYIIIYSLSIYSNPIFPSGHMSKCQLCLFVINLITKRSIIPGESYPCLNCTCLLPGVYRGCIWNHILSHITFEPRRHPEPWHFPTKQYVSLDDLLFPVQFWTGLWSVARASVAPFWRISAWHKLRTWFCVSCITRIRCLRHLCFDLNENLSVWCSWHRTAYAVCI